MSRLFKAENTLRFLTIPGGGGSPSNHWQSHWENECSTMARVDQDDWDTPVKSEWADLPAPYASFRSIPLYKLQIPSLVIASSNDPYLSLSRAKFLAKAWGSELKVLGEYGHIGSESNLGCWQEGIDLLDSFSVHCMEVKKIR